MCVRDWQSQICAVYYRQRGGAVAKQDTLMKALTKSLSSGALEAIGVYGVELTESLPTELPANTLRVDMAWAMLAKGLGVALVSEVTGLPAEELEQLRKELSN